MITENLSEATQRHYREPTPPPSKYPGSASEKNVQVGHSITALHRKGLASWPLHCCTAPKRVCKLATPCCTASTRGVHIIASLHRKGRATWPLYCYTVSRRTHKLSGSIENETMMRGNVKICLKLLSGFVLQIQAFIVTQSCIDMRLHL